MNETDKKIFIVFDCIYEHYFCLRLIIQPDCSLRQIDLASSKHQAALPERKQVKDSQNDLLKNV